MTTEPIVPHNHKLGIVTGAELLQYFPVRCNPIGIPQELREQPLWCIYRAQWKEGDKEKPTKVPCHLISGELTDVASPYAAKNGCDFSLAMGRREREADKWIGPGYIITTEKQLVIFDFDKCRDPETGEIDHAVLVTLNRLETYAEVSASGKGVHAICYGTLDKRFTGKHIKLDTPDGEVSVEIYTERHALLMTGVLIEHMPDTIEARQKEIEQIAGYVVENVSTSKKKLKGIDGINAIIAMPANDPNRGNSTLESLIGYCGNSMHYSPEKTLELVNRWNHQSNDPMDDREVERMVWDNYNRYPYKVVENAEAQQFTCSNLGNAERFRAQYDKRFRFVYELEEWVVYENGRWQKVTNQAHAAMKKTVRRIYSEAAEAPSQAEREAIIKHALKSESAYAIESSLRLARYERGMMVSIDDFDQNHWLANFPNGTMDLRTGKMREHNPDDMLMKQIPIEYKEDVTSLKWLKFLERVQPDPKMRAYLQRIVGYIMTGLIREEAFWVFYGSGENGKGTFIETLLALFDDYGITTPMATFANKHYAEGGDKASPDIARMKGARLISVSETNETTRFNEGLIKNLTGSDTITARNLYGRYFQFMPTHKIIFSVNHKPIIKDTTIGMWRRLKLVPFTERITAEERDNDLKRALREEELQGVLNWCIEGCLAWQREGLNQPEEVTAATDRYKEDSDPLQRWLDDWCEEDAGAYSDNRTLYPAYQIWCEINNEKEEIPRVWGGQMQAKGFEPFRRKRDGITERGYKGVRLSERHSGMA